MCKWLIAVALMLTATVTGPQGTRVQLVQFGAGCTHPSCLEVSSNEKGNGFVILGAGCAAPACVEVTRG